MNQGRGKWSVENDQHEASHLLLTGLSGKGKSWLARKIIEEDRAPWKFAFDTYKKEFHTKLGWTLCYDLPTLQGAYRAGQPSTFICEPLFGPDTVAGFNFWIDWVVGSARILPGRKLIIVEEVQTTTKSRLSTPHPQFAWMVDQGRGIQFDLLMTAQRLNTLNEAVRSSVTECCTFQHVWKNQLDWLQEEGFDPAAVKVLERGEYIWLDKERGTLRSNARKTSADQTRAGSRSPAPQV